MKLNYHLKNVLQKCKQSIMSVFVSRALQVEVFSYVASQKRYFLIKEFAI